MCNFRTVLVGSSWNTESSSSSLLLSFLHTVSSPFLTDVIFLCTVSAAHPLLQMRPLAVSNKLDLHVSMNITSLLTTHTVSCWSHTRVSHALIDPSLLRFSVVVFYRHITLHRQFFSGYSQGHIYPYCLIECDIHKGDGETEREVPCLDIGIIREERTEKEEIKKRIRALGPWWWTWTTGTILLCSTSYPFHPSRGEGCVGEGQMKGKTRRMVKAGAWFNCYSFPKLWVPKPTMVPSSRAH